MNKDVQKARHLIAVVHLMNVRLVNCSAKAGIRLADVTDEMGPEFSHSAKAVQGSEPGVFYVLSGLRVRVVSESSEVSHAELNVQFELEYRVPSDFKPTRSEISAFARVNGVFNAWPYFREFVQSTSQKMDLPVIILPVYRVPQAPRPSAAQEPITP